MLTVLLLVLSTLSVTSYLHIYLYTAYTYTYIYVIYMLCYMLYICTYWVIITCDAYFWLIYITSKTTSIFCKIPFKHVCSSLIRRLMNRLIHLRVEIILIYILSHCKGKLWVFYSIIWCQNSPRIVRNRCVLNYGF